MIGILNQWRNELEVIHPTRGDWHLIEAWCSRFKVLVSRYFPEQSADLTRLSHPRWIPIIPERLRPSGSHIEPLEVTVNRNNEVAANVKSSLLTFVDGLLHIASMDLLVKDDVMNEGQSTPPPTNVVFHGSNYGAVQLNSPHSVQNNVTTIGAIGDSVKALRDLLVDGRISELDREDASHAIDRVEQLAQRPKSPNILARIKEKLDLVKGTLASTTELATAAAPHIAAILQWYGS